MTNKKYKIKNTNILHNGVLKKIGDEIELDENQAKKLEDVLILIGDADTSTKTKTTNNNNSNKTSTQKQADTPTPTNPTTPTTDGGNK